VEKLQFTLYSDPAAFRAAVFPFLLRQEALHNVMLSVVNAVVDEPTRYPRYYLGVISQGDKVVGATWMTPPYALGLSDMPIEAVDLVIQAAENYPDPVNGVFGATEPADYFCREWTGKHARTVRHTMRQGVYQLKKVIALSNPTAGRMRTATQADFDLLVDWNLQFYIDCKLPEHEYKNSIPEAHRAIEKQNRFLWETDSGVVAMAGAVGESPSGVRFSWVYTPPAFRGRRYASQLMQYASQFLLDRGKKLCFLYTDLTNAASNSVYQRVGYEKVGECVSHEFI
jgi:ribosomal protein S18 acetylase RimI-like enzyme